MDSEVNDRKRIDAWVRKLNRLAAELDAETNSMHPSAWEETLRDRNAKWRQLATSNKQLRQRGNSNAE